MNESESTERKRTYRCAQCSNEFTLPLGASIVAEAESMAMFPGAPEKEMVVVCDKCYPKLAEKTLKMQRQGKLPWQKK